MAAMKRFFPATGSEAEWNAAYYRLEDYFRALRLVNKVHQSQIILGLLESAAARHARDPTQSPTSLAMEEVHATIEQWFERIFGQRERLNTVGLISLLAVDAMEKWPLTFPAEEIPDELRRELRESEVYASPDLLVSSMTPRPIDVSPLLEPVHLGGGLEKARRIAIVAAAILAGVSIYIFLIIR